MGRGARVQADASGLLYGPRNSRVERDHEQEFAQAVAAADFNWARRLYDKIDKGGERLRQVLAEKVIEEERYAGNEILETFGIRAPFADSIVIENQYTQNQILHFSEDALSRINDSLGYIGSHSETACGKDLVTQGGDSGMRIADGGRARRGAWVHPPSNTSHCPDCQAMADQFPESREDLKDGPLLPGLDRAIAEDIDLDSADLLQESRAAYRRQFVEAAVEAAIAGGEDTFKRLYASEYGQKTNRFTRFFAGKLSERVKEDEWRNYITEALDDARTEERKAKAIAISMTLDEMLDELKLPRRFTDV